MPQETPKSVGFEGGKSNTAFRRGNNYVLCIGIDEYEKSPLYNCVRDIEAFTRVLVERYDFKEDNITRLVNHEAKRDEINDRLRAYADSITEDDSFLLYYSGHGKFDHLEEEGYWLTYGCDFNNYANKGIANQEIVRKIKAIKARHITLLVDSCFSGSLFYTDKDFVQTPEPDALERYRSRWAITAGRNEPVSDGLAGQHSPFAKCVINFLKTNHKDGRFSISELGVHVQRVLPANSDQSPDGRPLHKTGHEGGQFVFYLKTETKEQAAFKEAMELRDIRLLENFLVDFEDSPHKTEVKKRLKELRDNNAWAIALKKNSIEGFDDYIDDYKSGLHVEEARDKKRELRKQRDHEATLRQGQQDKDKKQQEQERERKEEAAKALAREEVEKKKQETVHRNHEKTNNLIDLSDIADKLSPKKVESDPFADLMVHIKGGSFNMGDRFGYSSEKPVHRVTIKNFNLCKHPVTQAQWEAVMGDNPSSFKGGDLPVENVSWDDAQAFIKKLNQMLSAGQKPYRLPTEAEWEYASRGRAQSKGFKYAGSNNAGEVAWYRDNSGSKTHPVGQKKANELGLYDMSGNVWEWCEDWYDSKFYEKCAAEGILENPRNDKKGSTRVLRGGSWSTFPGLCRVTYRRGVDPETRDGNNGFRLAASPSSQ